MSKMILIIEDEESIQNIIKAFLELSLIHICGRSSVKTELQGLKSAQTGQRRQAASKEQAR